MEALQLHPAAQAAADDASMHGAGPMQARFSPYDYNGGSVHCPSPPPLPIRVAEERVAGPLSSLRFFLDLMPSPCA
jgi:hypothetical protein